MRYSIENMILASGQAIDIDLSEFEQIRNAKRGLLEGLFVEQKFSLLLENYMEFERDLLDRTLTSTVFSGKVWSSFVNDIEGINRRIVNLLSACRLYADHVSHHLGVMFGKNSPEQEAAIKAFKSEYDSTLGYRVMDAMRNHVQHHGLPIHKLTRSHARTEARDNEEPRVRIVSVPIVDLARLRENKKFKRSILKELEKLDTPIDLRCFVRESVESISRVHHIVRAQVASRYPIWESVLARVLERFRAQFKNRSAPIAAIARNDDGVIVEKIQVFDEFIKHRRALERKYRGSLTLTRDFISSEIIT